MLDLDPVLLGMAAAQLGGAASASSPPTGPSRWTQRPAPDDYDAVLTATALHWLPADRLTGLYAEIRTVLRPGGISSTPTTCPTTPCPR